MSGRPGDEALAADLHCHSTASDGRLAPGEVVRTAFRRGVRVLALADHDTVAGVPAAQETAAPLGLEVIPALELSATLAGREVHLLGYFVDLTSREFLRTLERMQGERRRRARLMVARLAALGCPLDWGRLQELAGGGSIGRAHVARALLEKGFVGSVRQAFDQFLAEGRPAYVPHARLTTEEGIRLIRTAGGVPVLAHPGLVQADHLIPALKDQGLAGLEVVHPAHDVPKQAYYRRLADDLGLLPTGGSDAHGGEEPHEQPGAVRIPLSWVERLREAVRGSA